MHFLFKQNPKVLQIKKQKDKRKVKNQSIKSFKTAIYTTINQRQTDLIKNTVLEHFGPAFALAMSK